ncbi:hypothetical protein KUCAC02_011135 [Chaenocephalus aceratus]|uniref:Uncharacterized protein n=1 Tax=Chaenocephalus aceratus TaxID=36190 RepID=A0ACB9WUU1_CHAAC|nr:hypothetical protein KUCAC02_011135 [Chaenocephalus aceratus]
MCCASLEESQPLMKMGLSMVLIGHMNFLLGALVHGVVLRHINFHKQARAMEYAISNVVALTSGLVGIVVGILAILLSKNKKSKGLTWSLLTVGVVASLTAAASAIGLLVSMVRTILHDGRSLLTHCRFPDAIGYSSITNECPFDPTRIYFPISRGPSNMAPSGPVTSPESMFGLLMVFSARCSAACVSFLGLPGCPNRKRKRDFGRSIHLVRPIEEAAPPRYAEAPRNYAEPPRSYTEATRSYAEAPRNYAEAPRNYAEAPRNYAEPPRSYAEPPRNHAESPRSSAEPPRNYAEPPRSYTEATRNYAEPPRNHAESPRNYAESPRNYAEPPRNYAESPRNYAESPRNYAEPPRNHAESPRNYAESPRNYAEPPRNYAESPRNYAEPPRNYAEPPRNHAESPRKSSSLRETSSSLAAQEKVLQREAGNQCWQRAKPTEQHQLLERGTMERSGFWI